MRRCPGCNTEKSREDFYPSPSLTRCRVCHRARARKLWERKKLENANPLGERGRPEKPHVIGVWALTSGVCMAPGCNCRAVQGILALTLRPPSRALVSMCAEHAKTVIDVCL